MRRAVYMDGSYAIDGVPVRAPSKATYNLIPIVSDENRLENADLVLRPVAHKHKLTWTYDNLIGSALINILGSSWEKYTANKTYKFKVKAPNYKAGSIEIYCYFAEIKFDLVLDNPDPNLRFYSGLTMTWIEY